MSPRPAPGPGCNTAGSATDSGPLGALRGPVPVAGHFKFSGKFKFQLELPLAA